MTDSTILQSVTAWLGSGSVNIFGLPFAGKDTQAEKLALELDGVRLSGGEILRNSVIPEHVREAIDAGGLAPTNDYIEIVLPYLSKPEFAGKPLILSSVGRWHGEEDGVLEATERSGHQTKAVIFLSIDETVLHERWQSTMASGGRGDRADDADEEKLAMRLAEFSNKTLPVIDYYEEKGLLTQIDASQSADVVYNLILEALASRASVAR